MTQTIYKEQEGYKTACLEINFRIIDLSRARVFFQNLFCAVRDVCHMATGGIDEVVIVIYSISFFFLRKGPVVRVSRVSLHMTAIAQEIKRRYLSRFRFPVCDSSSRGSFSIGSSDANVCITHMYVYTIAIKSKSPSPICIIRPRYNSTIYSLV